MRVLLFSLLLLLISPLSHAQDIEACGVPESANLSTEPSTAFCDIYQRQLQYRVEANTFRDQINERNEAYANSRRVAYQNYLQDLEQVDKERALKPEETAE